MADYDIRRSLSCQGTVRLSLLDSSLNFCIDDRCICVLVALIDSQWHFSSHHQSITIFRRNRKPRIQNPYIKGYYHTMNQLSIYAEIVMCFSRAGCNVLLCESFVAYLGCTVGLSCDVEIILDIVIHHWYRSWRVFGAEFGGLLFLSIFCHCFMIDVNIRNIWTWMSSYIIIFMWIQSVSGEWSSWSPEDPFWKPLSATKCNLPLIWNFHTAIRLWYITCPFVGYTLFTTIRLQCKSREYLVSLWS